MIRELTADGVTVRLDLEPQVLALDAPEIEVYSEPELAPQPATNDGFVAAAVLAHKAKHFDDALYERVELTTQRGMKQKFLRAWAEAALAAAQSGEAACVLLAACELGGTRLPLPVDVASKVAQLRAAFLADPRRSTPLGFYTNSEELRAIFQQDRMLMQELREPEAADALAARLSADAALSASYQRLLALASHLTNPPPADAHDLLARGADARRILVPSRSHESDLVLKLYGNRPIPDGFDLAAELAQQIAAGKLSLAPRADSGWYDHQTYALESLVAPDRAREHSRLQLTKLYREHLHDLFKGLLALTRETHVKQLEPPLCGSAFHPGPKKIFVAPELSAEPLASYYLRRAASYRFVRAALERLGLRNFEQEIDAMEALFYGAHVRVCRQLGIEPEALAERDADRDAAAFVAWQPQRDADVGRDSRMMVPVFYDVERKRMKVWALLGWSSRPLEIAFHTPPRVLEAHAPTGRFTELKRRFRSEPAAPPPIDFTRVYRRVPYPVTAELYVDALLDRDAFRTLCDTHKTRSAILRALE